MTKPVFDTDSLKTLKNISAGEDPDFVTYDP
jgi:hypothetical protein